MSLLELKNISFSYDSQEILKNISFSINEGETLGVIGPNGGGKSTLLKIISGILFNFQGEIIFNKKITFINYFLG